MKYSSLAYGVALGLCAVAVVGGLVTLAGGTPQLAALVWLFAGCCGLVPVLEAGIDLLRLYRSDRLTERDRELKQMEVAARLSLLSAPVEVAAPIPAVADEALEYAWRLALGRFFRAGEAAGGFSENRLAGVVGSDTWVRLIAFYGQAQSTPAGKVVGPVLRDAGGNVGNEWNYGWGLDAVLPLLEASKLPRPGGAVPDVAVYIQSAAQRGTARKGSRRSSEVVESAFKE